MLVVHMLRVDNGGAEDFRGVFPDVPGPIVTAADLPLLQLRAREALLVELQRLEAAGLDWPEPRTVAALQADPASLPGLNLLVNVTVDTRS